MLRSHDLASWHGGNPRGGRGLAVPPHEGLVTLLCIVIAIYRTCDATRHLHRRVPINARDGITRKRRSSLPPNLHHDVSILLRIVITSSLAQWVARFLLHIFPQVMIPAIVANRRTGVRADVRCMVAKLFLNYVLLVHYYP